MRKVFSLAAASVIVFSLASCTTDEPEKKTVEDCKPVDGKAPEGCEEITGEAGESTPVPENEALGGDVEAELTGETVPMSMEGDATTPFTDEENKSKIIFSMSVIAANEEYVESEDPKNPSGMLKTVPADLENLFKNLSRDGFDAPEDYLPTETTVENYVPIGTQYAGNGPFKVLGASRPVILSGDGDPNAKIEDLKKIVGSNEALTVTVCDANDNQYTALMSSKWEKLRGVWKVSSLYPTMLKCEGGKAARDFAIKEDPLLTGEAKAENLNIQKEALKFAKAVEDTNGQITPGPKPETVEEPEETTEKQ